MCIDVLLCLILAQYFFCCFDVCATLSQCQKAFPRFISRHMGFKKHCHICGNIVCAACLNVSAVRIVEFAAAAVAGAGAGAGGRGDNKDIYVDACASCFWGQVHLIWRMYEYACTHLHSSTRACSRLRNMFFILFLFILIRCTGRNIHL